MKQALPYVFATCLAGIAAGTALAGPQEAANYFQKVETWHCNGEPDGVGRPPTASRIAMNVMPGYSVIIYQNEGLKIRGETYSRILRYEGKLTLTEPGFRIESTSVITESEDALPGFGNWPTPFNLKLELAPREDHPLDYAFNGSTKSSRGETSLFCFASTFKS